MIRLYKMHLKGHTMQNMINKYIYNARKVKLIAGATGCTPDAVRGWRRGRSTPQPATIYIICCCIAELYNKELSDLLVQAAWEIEHGQ